MKKKVLIICGVPHFNFFDKHSAVAAYLLSIKANLEEQGYIVLLSHPENPNALNQPVEKKSSSGVRKFVKRLSGSVYQTLLDSVYFKNQSTLQKNLLTGERPDHIIEFLTYGSDIGFALKKKFGCPLLIIYDSPIAQQYKEMHGTYSVFLNQIEKSEKNSVEAADDIVCYSEPVKRYLESKHSINSKIHILPTIIWEKMTPKSDAILEKSTIDIGFFGSFLKWHKVDLLVNVFADLVEEFPQMRLHLCGYGAEWQNINARVAKLPCRDKVFLPGFVHEEELQKIKDKIDIGLMPGSNWYGSPLKIFEYAWLKIPVIAANTPTIAYLFRDGKDILLIDPDHEYESLKDHFRKIMLDRDFGNMLGLNLYNTVEDKFSRKKYYQLFSDILLKVSK